MDDRDQTANDPRLWTRPLAAFLFAVGLTILLFGHGGIMKCVQ
jgi:hypothetical protein